MNFHTPSAVGAFKGKIYLELSGSQVSQQDGLDLRLLLHPSHFYSSTWLEIGMGIQKVNFLDPESHWYWFIA